MDTQLANRVVLVTGASGGIGGEVVRAFVREGTRVVAHFAEHGERAEALAQELGTACVPLGADLTLEAEVERLFAEIEAGLGPVEVLVANAGHWPPSDTPLTELTLKQWDTTLAVNLTSVFLCLREFCRGVRKHGQAEPAAVLIGSTAALFGEAGHADYAAAKAALTYGLARSMKNELAGLDDDGAGGEGDESGAGAAGVTDDPAAQGGPAARRGRGGGVPGVGGAVGARQRAGAHGGRRHGGAGAVPARRGGPGAGVSSAAWGPIVLLDGGCPAH